MKIENDYLVLEEKDIKHLEKIGNKKIAGHSFVGLCGFNEYKKPGDVLLEMHKFIVEDVPKGYLLRGDLAEKIVKNVYSRNHKCVTYDKKEIKYDNFKEFQNCGGLIDIEIPSEYTLIEVKSKDMSKYETICNEQPKQEVYQALYYGYLRGYEKITMEWIFFDDETNKLVMEGMPYLTLANIKRFTKEYTVNPDEIKGLITEALKKVFKFRIEKRIPLSELSDSAIKAVTNQKPTQMSLEDLDEIVF